jgi:hypothetical protein
MSWFLNFSEGSSAGSAQQIRLRMARFRHLLCQYGQIIALGADAAEKQTGEYVLDNAYILALSDKAFESAERMVYDLNVLTSKRCIGFYDAVEALREKTTAIISARAAEPLSALEEKEEPEHWLLRETRKCFFHILHRSAERKGIQFRLFSIVNP